jgi:hypothetical protein
VGRLFHFFNGLLEAGIHTMQTNRISRFSWQETTSQPVAVMAPQGFVACPTTMLSGTAAAGWTWQQEIFCIAYAAARANHAAMARAAASDYHRLFSNWN